MAIRRVLQLPIPAASLTATFGLMDERLRVVTNDPRVLDAAAASFGRFPVPPRVRPPLLVRLFSEAAPGRPLTGAPHVPPGTGVPAARTAVAPSAAASAPGPDPDLVFRMAGRTLLISRGPTDVAAVDVAGGTATGFIGAATAADPAVLRYSFLEAMALSMLSRGRGYLAVHAAAVVHGGVGLVLHGPAGAGKSTLTLACARRGYGVLAEDSVFVRLDGDEVGLWGMPWRQRLLPDAADHFPELRGLEPRPQPNGERKLEVDLDDLLPGRAVTHAVLGAVVLVARGTGGDTRLEVLAGTRDADAIEVHWPYDGGWSAAHDAAVAALEAAPRYRLHVNGTPDAAVDALDALLPGARRGGASPRS